MNNSDSLPLILTVDDEPANLVLLERLLKSQYRVMTVTDGQAALDMLAQAPFDLVLLDIMMPGMTGLQVLDVIRHNPQTADVPVILVSALTEVHDITNGLEMGANDYITKPIDLEITQARVHTQITLKLLQDERKATIAKLEAAQEMKNRFIRMASHDLKSPLMNLRLVMNLLSKGSDLSPQMQELMDAAETSLDTMKMVIQDFLDTAALQSDAQDIRLSPVQVEPVIRDLLLEHSVNSTRKNIALETGSTDGLLLADVFRFKQALGNLISNAIKYSPSDTTVRVWTECDRHRVQIFVADQGPGIPAQDHDRLFTEFGRLTPRPTGGEASTGLGLWIVKHLITLQRGQVGLIAPSAGGSIFWIDMPAESHSVDRR
ncbi:MAG: hybrid sensor histidine kinase/response regulator [Anaerolineae bacterium]|nr:hybrid sensor histidine kinase/response regulator [Anaerolineae bacterium]